MPSVSRSPRFCSRAMDDAVLALQVFSAVCGTLAVIFLAGVIWHLIQIHRSNRR